MADEQIIEVTLSPVFQTRFGGTDVPWEEQGNCHAAVLASIFGVPLSTVPEPAHPETGQHWSDAHIEWLRERGFGTWWHDLTIVEPVRLGDEFAIDLTQLDYTPSRYLSMGGDSPRGNFGHVVVYDTETGRIVHDPHPSGDGLLNVEDIQTFFRLGGDS